MSNVPTALSLIDVSDSYGAKNVVDQISFDVHAGEIFGLIGLNGAGKTTIIKNILDLRPCTAGEIKINGKKHTSKQSKDQLSYLPEKFEPPAFLSGFEFLKFALSLYKKSCELSDMEEVARSLALDPDALKRRVNSYSKGMRQKLGLMATMLTGCQLYILDEPMSGLDPRARALVKKMLIERKNKSDTIFFSSHVLSDMDEVCDRVAILHDKRIQFLGKPADFKSKMGVDNLEVAFLKFIECSEAA